MHMVVCMAGEWHDHEKSRQLTNGVRPQISQIVEKRALTPLHLIKPVGSAVSFFPLARRAMAVLRMAVPIRGVPVMNRWWSVLMGVIIGRDSRSNGSTQGPAEYGTITTTDFITNGSTSSTTDTTTNCRIQRGIISACLHG
jgi:hypothetical protein